jgi:hypothetical protein
VWIDVERHQIHVALEAKGWVAGFGESEVVLRQTDCDGDYVTLNAFFDVLGIGVFVLLVGALVVAPVINWLVPDVKEDDDWQ